MSETKSKKKKTKKAKAKGMTEAEEIEKMKELHLIEMKNRRLEELEHENDKLKGIAKELRIRLDRLEDTHQMSMVFVKNKMDGYESEAKRRERDFLELMELKKREGEQAAAILKSVHEDFQEEIAQKEAAHKVTFDKYEELARFEAEKADLMANLASLQKTLDEERARHMEIVANQDRHNMLQKAWLKNEMLEKIRETKMSLLAMTEDQLHTTTKRTIMENEQMTTELQYQSRETERIVRRNQDLVKSNNDLRRRLDLAEESQVMLAKRTQFFQKYIKKLTEKLSQAEKEGGVGGGAGSGVKVVQDLPQVVDEKKKKTNQELIRKLEAQLQEQTEIADALNLDNQRLSEQLSMAESASRRIISLQDETTAFILASMEEIKDLHLKQGHQSGHSMLADIENADGTGRSRWHPNQPLPTSLAEVTSEERWDILELLLQKLSYYEASRRAGGAGYLLSKSKPSQPAQMRGDERAQPSQLADRPRTGERVGTAQSVTLPPIQGHR
jgi:hypothetical protein